MSTFQTDRLKSSRHKSVAENGNNHPRQPRVVGTSDADGVTIDLRATPGYQDTELTLAEVARL